jgi:hypothetical protein
MGGAGQLVFLMDLPTADPDRNMVDRSGSLAEFIALYRSPWVAGRGGRRLAV